MAETPSWFGPDARPLFGIFHTPDDGHARAGVVLCPPLGRDSINAHWTYRLLGRRLAELGLVALRFDYDGTGDSAGNDMDPDRVAAWIASVREAITAVRACGVDRVAVVGMRVGASLAAAALSATPADALVLWDPISGRAYVTEQRTLSALSVEAAARADGAVELPGFIFTAGTVSELAALNISATEGPLADRVLVLTRPGRTPERRSTARLTMLHIEWGEAVGQEELIERPSPAQEVPAVALEQVATWLDDVLSGPPAPVAVPTNAAAVVERDADGRRVVERLVRLGPCGLSAVETTTEGASSPAAPTIVMLSVANEHHIGPNRMWVDLSRRWAHSGLRSLRVDLSGLGDSPTRPGEPEGVFRSMAAFDDVADVARAASPDDPSNVVLVGLCSSGYQAIESGLEVGTRGICAINPVMSFLPPEMEDGPLDPRRRACLPRTGIVTAFHANGPLSPIRRMFPDLTWRIRNLLARRGRPNRWLEELVSQGVDTLFICGEAEARPILAAGALDKLSASGRLRLELIPDLDHGVTNAALRDRAVEVLNHHVVTRFAPDPVGELAPAGHLTEPGRTPGSTAPSPT